LRFFISHKLKFDLVNIFEAHYAGAILFFINFVLLEFYNHRQEMSILLNKSQVESCKVVPNKKKLSL